MEFSIERYVATKGRDENIIDSVVFPCNTEDLQERFKVDDVAELQFIDNRDERMSVKQFNYIMRDAEARAAKIEDEINAVVKFLLQKLERNPEYKGISDNLALSYEDNVVWDYCMKKDYKHPDEKVKVWSYKNSLTVFYGEKKD